MAAKKTYPKKSGNLALKVKAGAFKAKSLGQRFRKITGSGKKGPLPMIKYFKGMKPDVLRRFFQKGTNKLVNDATISRIFRAAHGQQDELFSTELTKEFVKGFFETKGSPLSAADIDYLNKIIDLASSVRMPTEYSGFATKDAVMQHPANREKALFADPYKTASLHSKLNTERRIYVEKALERALDAGKDPTTAMVEGLKAAIEFTLNYFTAPITADNVLPFSKSSGKAPADPELQKQLVARERLKVRFTELGGDLRTLQMPENQIESQARGWGLARDTDGSALEAPPSPRRSPFGVANDAELMAFSL